jgi:hypothetical protein
MSLQVIHDNKGNATGVFIPMPQWKQLKKQHKDLEGLEYEAPTKAQLLIELKQAVQELKQVEQGKLKANPIEALLNEL